LITSIVDCLFRKSLATRNWKIRDNLYIFGGQIETDLDKLRPGSMKKWGTKMMFLKMRKIILNE
jgi:hypothetical protein